MENDVGKKVIFIMGVSGSGKTTIGQLLAQELSIPFIDADDHHSEYNIEKMSQGVPLTDRDRKPWLQEVNRVAIEHFNSSGVIACSALKKDYRRQLEKSIETKVIWVYLKGSFEQIYERMKSRPHHYMRAGMLESQFDALQEPMNALVIDIRDSPAVVIEKIKAQLV